MNVLTLYNEIVDILERIDGLVSLAVSEEIDCSELSTVKSLLSTFLASIEQGLGYKADRNMYYGDPLDEEGRGELKTLIKELGYDEVASMFDVADLLEEE